MGTNIDFGLPDDGLVAIIGLIEVSDWSIRNTVYQHVFDVPCETMNLHKEMINVDLNVSHPKIPTV